LVLIIKKLEFISHMALRRQTNRSQRMESLEPYSSSTKKVNAGICYAFKGGSCVHGESCKFSHDLTTVDPNEVVCLESPRLYVNNLSWDVTWQDLKGLFRGVSTEQHQHAILFYVRYSLLIMC
jgi:hypothetical protein